MHRWLAPIVLLLASCSGTASTPQGPTAAVELRGQRIQVELATDDASRQHGLMMRTELAANHGMLFVFPHSGPQAFWMKNTLISLDILYFDTDRRLVSMQLDVPPCRADPCPTYPSEAPALYVLELSAGSAQRMGVHRGDELKVMGEIESVR